MGVKEKLKILAVPANTGGCAYYRIIMPMEKLAEKYPDEVEVRFNENPLGVNKEKGGILEDFDDFADMKWADIVFTQNISNFGGPYTVEVMRKAWELGKFTHFDTDDLLTDLYEGHRLYDVYKENKLDEITSVIYQNADLVTVTQRKFAERIAPHVRKALVVIKNQIDYDLPCWNIPKVLAPRKKLCRVGWVGGIHHEEDVSEIRNHLLGVNTRVGVENVRWDFYGRPPQNPDEEPDWQQDVWDQYEKILSHGLNKRRRNWQVLTALPCHAYGAFYSNMDVSIAPLQYNAFNDSKSEIKVMEAGRYGIPLICSDVGCYSETIVNGETGYVIPKENLRNEWVRILTRVCKDKKHREEMGRNLKKITDERFDINKTVGQRLDLYRQLINLKETAKDEQKEKQNI